MELAAKIESYLLQTFAVEKHKGRDRRVREEHSDEGDANRLS